MNAGSSNFAASDYIDLTSSRSCCRVVATATHGGHLRRQRQLSMTTPRSRAVSETLTLIPTSFALQSLRSQLLTLLRVFGSTLTFDHIALEDATFLPRNARSAKHGIAIVSRPSARPSICLSVYNVEVPWAYRLD